MRAHTTRRFVPWHFAAAVFFLLQPAMLAQTVSAAETVDFESQVWPILEAHCVICHGAKQSYSNLRLDSAEAILRGGELGEVLVEGDPEGSELYRRTAVAADDLDFMPVDAEPLSKEHRDLLRTWIAEGAGFGAWTG
ncbi:MAG: hypothetical protein O7A04_10935 [Acidobacteria bacterium]|nr:hypothetical protein [Acidobacteriota bacterium]